MFYSILDKTVEYLKIREGKETAVSVAARFRKGVAEAASVSHSVPQLSSTLATSIPCCGSPAHMTSLRKGASGSKASCFLVALRQTPWLHTGKWHLQEQD